MEDRDHRTGSARPQKRARTRPPFSPAPTRVDSFVRALHNDQGISCPPAWSTHTGLLAIAVPSSSTAAPPSLFADWFGTTTTDGPPQSVSTGPAIHLTHFSGADAATPRVRITLPVPVPPASNAGIPHASPSRRISHLSFSPDSSFLVAIVRDPSSREDKGASDSITLYEQRGACIDEWDCIAQEDAGRFAAQTSAPAAPSPKPKRVVSLRWVGEPRRWYPAPTFPDQAREESKKPLYCAPPRSAPLEGVAFVAVLSSDEVLFMHYPRHAPGIPPVPTFVCLPLHPSPAATISPTSPTGSTSSQSATAVALQPTPVPLVLSLGPGLGTVVVPPASVPPAPAAAKMSVDTPSATVDALVNSLVVKAEEGPAPSGKDAASSARQTGTPSSAATSLPKPTDLGSSQAALHAELHTQQQLEQRRKSIQGISAAFAAAGERTVDKAAIGACRSRGTAELGETVFVIATWSRDGPKRVRARSLAGGMASAAASPKKEENATAPLVTPAAMPPPPPAAAKTTTTTNGDSFMTDDDFSLMVDFSSLDEAFGGGSGGPTATAGTTGIVPLQEGSALVNGNGTADSSDDTKKSDEERELDEQLEHWRTALRLQAEEDAGGRLSKLDASSRWRVELTEVKVEMVFAEGARVTVRPQQPLHLSPLPAAAADGDDDSLEHADPILTHLTFLGDVALPHPLQQTTQSPTLLLDGSEAAVDLSLLAVIAHRHARSDTEDDPSERWSSTLTSYALSKEEAYPLSEAFQSLEGRKLDAPTQVDGESGWVSRLSACRPAGTQGLLCAVEIRPGGGEWASVTGLVANPRTGDAWESRVVRLSSPTLDVLDGEGSGSVMPGTGFFDAVVNSPNGAFVCALPHSTPQSPVIAAAPLSPGSVNDNATLIEPLAIRLAIAIVRQSDVGDLIGRVSGLRDADLTLAIVERTKTVLQAMLPGEGMLEASSLGMELLAVASTLYRSLPTLFARADAARTVLEAAACVRALKKAEKRERTGSQNYKPDADAIWPLVGYCSWYCSTFLDSLAGQFARPPSTVDAEQADPTLMLLLHPRMRMFISTGARALLALDAWLGSPESGVEGSEAIDLARTVLHDAVTNALGGAGLAAWVSVLEKVTSEMDGGPSMAARVPSPFWSFAIPESLQPQATTVRNLVMAALPTVYGEKQGAPPSPPATPTAIDQQLDLVRRARFSSRVAPARSCVRCGARTSAIEGAALDSEMMVGKWRRFEAEWNGRCICGGLWRRASP